MKQTRAVQATCPAAWEPYALAGLIFFYLEGKHDPRQHMDLNFSQRQNLGI